jgi:CubicO group peptidase (beta-lactamase class C family)
MVDINGVVEPGFEGVADAFRRNFDEHGDVGAGYCLHVEGRKVVDVWGGIADRDTGRPYDEDTLQLVFSTTKGATAICANRLADRGELDIDAPVVEYWPEFGAEGKEEVPVRWLLTHQVGLPGVDAPLTLDDALAWEPVIDALEQQKPFWEPGTAHGYHALTYGWLVGEVVRRVSGKSLGTYFADEVAAPLGLDFWIGLPDEQQDRVAPLIGGLAPPVEEMDETMRALFEQFMGPDSLAGRALSLGGAFAEQGVWNQPRVRAAEIPAANGVTNARSLSRMYAAVIGEIDGVRLLSPEQVDKARTCQTKGADKVLMFETTIGLGFWTSSPAAPYGGKGAFGHSGAGGSMGFADPEHGLAGGYVMNQMQSNLAGDPRTLGLIKATYAAVDAPAPYV